MFSQTFRRLAQQPSLRFVANQAPMATTQFRDYRTAGSTNRQTRSDYGGQHNTTSRGSSSSGGYQAGSSGITGGDSMGGSSTGRGSSGRGSTGGRTQTTSSGQSRGGSRSTSTTSTGSRGTRGTSGTSGMAIPSMSATTININTSPFSGVREEGAGRGAGGNQQRRRMSTNRGYSKERSGEHLESQQQGRQGSSTTSGSSSNFGTGSGRGSSQFGQNSGVNPTSSQSVNNSGRSGSGATPSGSSDNVGSSGSFTSQSRSSNFPSSVDKPNANPFDAQGSSMNERAQYQRSNPSSTSSGYSQQRQGVDQSIISNTEGVATHPQGVDHSQRGAGNRADGSGRQGSGYSQQNYNPQGVSQGQSTDDQPSTSGRAGYDQTFKRDSFQQQDQNQRGSQYRQPNSGRQNQGR